MLKDSIQEEFFRSYKDKLALGFKILIVSNYKTALSILEEKAADCIVVSRFFAYSEDSKKLKPTFLILEKTTLHYATTKGKNTDLLVAIDKNLTEMFNRGNSAYYKSLERWLHEKRPELIFNRYLFISILVTGFLLIVSIVFNLLLKWQVNLKTREIRDKNIKLEKALDELQIKKEELLSTLRQRESLLRELRHRTRNNLNIISSIIGLKAMLLDSSLISEFSRDLKEKIFSMALAQKVMEDCESYCLLDVKKYLNEFVKSLSEYYPTLKGKIDFDLRIEPLELSTDVAFPFCFVLNELVSISYYYISDNNLKDNINIEIELFKKGKTIYFSYYDGIFYKDRISELSEKKIFGLPIVYEIVQKQLYGEVSFNKDENRLYIKFPEKI
ncbi:MAG: sensor histidine kinase [Brevinematia bacterium]